MRDIWEIVDRDRPSDPRPRFATIARATRECNKARPVGRFYVKYVNDDKEMER